MPPSGIGECRLLLQAILSAILWPLYPNITGRKTLTSPHKAQCCVLNPSDRQAFFVFPRIPSGDLAVKRRRYRTKASIDPKGAILSANKHSSVLWENSDDH